MGIVNQALPEDTLIASEHLPNRDSRFELGYPRVLNVTEHLLDRHTRAGRSAYPALRYNGHTSTYGALADRVNRLAGALFEKGLHPGDRILIHLPNCPEFVESWLAGLRIGAIVVASLPAYKRRELLWIVNDTQPVCLITNDELWPIVNEVAANTKLGIVVGDRIAGALAYEEFLREGSPIENTAPTEADDYAIIAYTSGSTGNPKGTCHTHGDLLAIADTYAREVLNPTPKDRFAGHTSMASTYGLGGLLVFPLRFGASTVLDSSRRFGPTHWLNLIKREQATIVFTTPTACRLCLEENICRSPTIWRSVRHIVTAGEPLCEITFRRWREATGLALLDGCGSTEMLHIWISRRTGEVQPGPLGRPVRLFETRLLDDSGHEIKGDEAEGRIALQGPTGCRYWRLHKIQAEAVCDGWTIPGDRFRRDNRGLYWYMGREDDVIVSAGYKISSLEVESILLEHPAIREAVIVAKPDEIRGQIIEAFVVVKKPELKTQALREDLRTFMMREMAAFKCPREIHFVERLPRTPTGKISRKVLRQKIDLYHAA
ncbi:MAG: acyl-CoA synthetase [Gammaproteobacteria bacterium]